MRAQVLDKESIVLKLQIGAQSQVNGPHPIDLLRAPGQQMVVLQGISFAATDTGNVIMGKLGSAFRRWCRTVKRIEIPPCTWNLHLIGRGDNDKRNYPELDSNVKAAHTKPILFFLAELFSELSQHCTCPLVNSKTSFSIRCICPYLFGFGW